MDFKDKVVLITGSSRGIGKATAIAFAKEGAKVIINCNDSSKEAESTLEEVQSLGNEAIFVKADVASEKEVKEMVEEIVKRFGRIDILVNNAGIVFDAPFAKKTVEQFKKTLDVNLVGMFICAKAVIPHMKKGKIINISSTNGIDSQSPDSIGYDASKAGVIAFTKALAEELAPNILVNCIAPGWVNTKMNKDLPKAYVKSETTKTWLKRFAKPSEIAKPILFLASDDASFITGETLIVDGGYP
jgi:3-oxoacyl-[acyl-carrier protein] reductase